MVAYPPASASQPAVLLLAAFLLPLCQQAGKVARTHVRVLQQYLSGFFVTLLLSQAHSYMTSLHCILDDGA